MKTTQEIMENLERELTYNSGTAVAYVKVGTSDLRLLLNLARKALPTSVVTTTPKNEANVDEKANLQGLLELVQDLEANKK